MNLSDLEAAFIRLGETDPFWTVLSNPGTRGGRWDIDEFFRVGQKDVAYTLAQLSELGVTVKRGLALDFGCGVGRLTQPLAREFKAVIGVDIASSMIKLANDLAEGIEGCSFVVNTREDLSQFGSATFDFIFSHIVFQHMEPRYALGYMREFGRLLRPGGVTAFQVLVPDGTHRALNWAKRNMPGFLSALRRTMRPGRPVIELHGIEPSRIVAALRDGGMEMIATRDDPNGGRGTRGMVVYAYKPATAA